MLSGHAQHERHRDPHDGRWRDFVW
jgi:hypothetical protein